MGRKFSSPSGLVSKTALHVYHTIKDQLKVSTVSGQSISPLSTSLQNGVCFIQPPLPARPSALLADHLPRYKSRGEQSGLPSSVVVTRTT
jgi:hypothetical protein